MPRTCDRSAAPLLVWLLLCSCTTAVVAPPDSVPATTNAAAAPDAGTSVTDVSVASDAATGPDWDAQIAACHAKFGFAPEVRVYDFAAKQTLPPTLDDFLAAYYTWKCRGDIKPSAHFPPIFGSTAACVAAHLRWAFELGWDYYPEAALVKAGKLDFYPAQAAQCIAGWAPADASGLAAACTDVFGGLPVGATCTVSAECHHPNCDVDATGCGHCAPPTTYVPVVNLPDAATCLGDSACASGYCAGFSANALSAGICKPLPKVGQPCLLVQPACSMSHCPKPEHRCSAGAACNGQSCVVAKSGAKGSACLDADACEPGLVCRFDPSGNGHCDVHGSGAPGDPCVDGNDCSAGTFCPVCKVDEDHLVPSVHCGPAKTAVCTAPGGVGAACEDYGADCQDGLTCAFWYDDVPSLHRQCQPIAKLGEPCLHDDQCPALDAICLGGVCKPHAAWCAPPMPSQWVPAGWCALGFSVDKGLGLCVPTPLGADCQSHCGPGLLCLQSQCVLPGVVGQLCYGEKFCKVGLQCRDFACAPSMCK